MKTRITIATAAASAALFGAACGASLDDLGSTGAGAGSFATGTAAIAIAAADSLGDDGALGLTFQDKAGVDLDLVSARAYLRDIELYLPIGVTCSSIADQLAGGASCGSLGDDSPSDDDEDKIEIEGPFVVDLMTGTASPDLSSVRVPALPYRRVDFRLDDARVRDGLISAGDPLEDRSIAIEADFVADGEVVRLSLTLDVRGDVRFRSADGISLETGDSLLLLFDTTGWMSDVEMDECLTGGDTAVVDGVLRLDGGDDRACRDLQRAVRDNIRESVRMGRRGRSADDGPGHDIGDDHGDHGPGHDIGDDHGDDGPGHDIGDDHGDDGPGHDIGDDHGDDGPGHDIGDDHGDDGVEDESGDDHGDDGPGHDIGDDNGDDGVEDESGDDNGDDGPGHDIDDDNGDDGVEDESGDDNGDDGVEDESDDDNGDDGVEDESDDDSGRGRGRGGRG
jgi:hypothetical protein